MGVIDRIDPVQAAREHKPAALARVVSAGRPSSGRDAENSWGGDDCKRHESNLSIHGGLLLLLRRDTDLWVVSTHGKSFGTIVVGQFSATAHRLGCLAPIVLSNLVGHRH